MKYFVASDIHGDSYWAERVINAFIDSKAGKVYDVDGNFKFYHNGNASTFIAPKGMPILNNGENVLEISEPETSGIFKIAILQRWCYL